MRHTNKKLHILQEENAKLLARNARLASENDDKKVGCFVFVSVQQEQLISFITKMGQNVLLRMDGYNTKRSVRNCV